MQHSPFTPTRLEFRRSLAETPRSPKAVKPRTRSAHKGGTAPKTVCVIVKKVQREKFWNVLSIGDVASWNDLRHMFYTHFSALQPAIPCKCCRRCVYQRYMLYINTIFRYYREWRCGAFISIYSVFSVKYTYLLQPKLYLSDMPSIRWQVGSKILLNKKNLC